MKEDINTPLEILRKKLELSYTPQEVAAIFHGFAQHRVTTLRINTLKITKEQFEHESHDNRIELIPVPWYEYAYILKSPTLREFTESPLYTEGKCYVQSLSSMLPPLVLDPQSGDKILDLCAAPGSKTSQLAMMVQNTGEILANDASHTRIYRLKANLERLGVTNTTVIRSVGQGLWHEYPNYFDRTLVDVPCSMEGRIQLDDPKSYEDWSPKKVKELQEVQKFLLRSGISATKPGGTIVYSTCTLSLEENEAVVEWILKKEHNHIHIEPIDLVDIPWTHAIESNEQKIFDPSIQQTKKIFPSEYLEGFYIAKFKKIA